MLKQNVPAATAARITALNLPGIALTPSYTRVYPNGDLAANLVGFTTSNTQGDPVGRGRHRAGGQRAAGRPGRQPGGTERQQRRAHPGGRPDQPGHGAGRNLRLTILASLQWEAEQACAQRVKQTDASNCTVVVMDPSTGQILAMAQSPSFNPAHPANLADTADMPVQ